MTDKQRTQERTGPSETTKQTDGRTSDGEHRASSNNKLGHLDEYKELRVEITLYQQEMHRTWLWAIMPAGAVYTWLALNLKTPSTVSSGVWFIPPFLIAMCFVRYWGFWSRIKRLASYQKGLEKDAFGKNPKEDLCGFARWEPSPQDWLSKYETAGWSIGIACGVWAVMFLCSVLLSSALIHDGSNKKGAPQSGLDATNSLPSRTTNIP